MSILQMDYASLLNDIQQDHTQKRFNAKVFLVNNFYTYFALIEKLEDMAEIVVNLSADTICQGEDTIPDLKRVLSVLDSSGDKNVLITSVGEYLRFGTKIEAAQRSLFSIISRPAHSRKRVWIPIYAAKDEFLASVGELEEEHFPGVVYEVEGAPAGFETTVYAKEFANTPGIVSISGMRAWLMSWDKKTIKSGTTLATRHAKQIKESDGLYSVKVVIEPFQYFQTRVSDAGTRISQAYGTNEQWLSLATKAVKKGTPIAETITAALNLQVFSPYQVLSRWNISDENTQWLFWLWYKLGLNSSSDYISYAVSGAKTPSAIPEHLEQAILSCVDNPNFDEWLEQRNKAIENLDISSYSEEFWAAFNAIHDIRKKLKLLSGRNHDEKTKIIELVSEAMNQGKSFSDYKSLLTNRYSDFVEYMSEPCYLTDELSTYIREYKDLKIKDTFSMAFSDSSENIWIHEYQTRAQILNKIKNSRKAYYIWIDGMGIEWIDLLLLKISAESNELVNPSVTVGTAVLPTITSSNMSCADEETVSLKLNDLDSLGHVKDKTDTNYFSIIAKQLSLISSIAQDVAKIAKKHPGKDIVITADHGMSRHAAKGFHSIDGVKAPNKAKIFSLGRYCEIPESEVVPSLSHTMKSGRIIAFKTHAHFSTSGYAPGELHGGASPEEILVPIIHFQRNNTPQRPKTAPCSYSINSTIYLSGSGMGELRISTQGPVDKVTVEIQATRIVAKNIGDNEWSVMLDGLVVNHSYTVQVYLNNIYSAKKENIYTATAGLAFDDDF